MNAVAGRYYPVLISDALTDYQAACAAGVQYIHVCTGRGAADAVPSCVPARLLLAILASA
ncbi:MAG: hypothetical protein M1118_04355 [Chloroflexi bacterium]|nr:hypothetical protein [Chloroflexota bacterium]